MKINKCKEKGITLIALVVTIVVLLILAGITITMVLGEDGILSQAKLAAEKTKEAEEQQEKDLQDLAGMINEAVNGKDPGTLQEALSSKKVFSNTTGYDSDGNKVDGSDEEKKAVITIPAGFKITEGDIKQIDKGVVISDEAGNEFVWVPCKESEYKAHTYTGDEKNDEGTNIEDEDNAGWNTWYYRKYNDWTDAGGNLESIRKYGGFFIARYEAGIPSTAPFYVDSASQNKTYTDEKQKNTSDYAPVSKKGAQAWNYIDQTHAKSAAEKMYSENRYVTSQLIDGKAWDRTVEWIAKSNVDIEKDSTNHGNYANTTELSITEDILYALHLEQRSEDYKGQGWNPAIKYSYGKPKRIGATEPYEENNFENYKDAKKPGENYHYRQLLELSTGASEDTKLNNIYDLAGNMYEWTTEKGYHKTEPSTVETSNKLFAVRRGGCLYDKGDDSPVSYRDGTCGADATLIHIGFRVVLYVK